MLTSTSSLEDHLDAYLSNRPYVGKSSYPNREKVKSAGAKFSGEAKLWYAPNEQVLRQLLHTEVWTPYPTALSREQMLSLLESRSENERRSKHREECNALKKEGPSESRVEEEIVKLLLIPPDSEAELSRLADWNVTPQMLEISKKNEILGPRSGYSTAARLLEGLKRKWVTPETIAPQEKKKKQKTKNKLGLNFGRTSFSSPKSREDEVHTPDKSIKRRRDESCYDLELELPRFFTGERPDPWSSCDICGENFLIQFGKCECMEVAQAFNL